MIRTIKRWRGNCELRRLVDLHNIAMKEIKTRTPTETEDENARLLNTADRFISQHYREEIETLKRNSHANGISLDSLDELIDPPYLRVLQRVNGEKQEVREHQTEKSKNQGFSSYLFFASDSFGKKKEEISEVVKACGPLQAALKYRLRLPLIVTAVTGIPSFCQNYQIIEQTTEKQRVYRESGLTIADFPAYHHRKLLERKQKGEKMHHDCITFSHDEIADSGMFVCQYSGKSENEIVEVYAKGGYSINAKAYRPLSYNALKFDRESGKQIFEAEEILSTLLMLPRVLLAMGTLTASEMLFHLISIPFTISKEYHLLQKAQEQWERQRVSNGAKRSI